MNNQKKLYWLSLVEWLAGGERGTSANTIVQHITGLPALAGADPDHPHDPADLKRCRQLLDQVPELVPYFERMRTCTPAWEWLVDHWDELCALMDEEAPNWRTGQGGCPKTLARMRALGARMWAQTG